MFADYSLVFCSPPCHSWWLVCLLQLCLTSLHSRKQRLNAYNTYTYVHTYVKNDRCLHNLRTYLCTVEAGNSCNLVLHDCHFSNLNVQNHKVARLAINRSALVLSCTYVHQTIKGPSLNCPNPPIPDHRCPQHFHFVQAIATLGRSVGLPGLFVTVWKNWTGHTHTHLL